MAFFSKTLVNILFVYSFLNFYIDKRFVFIYLFIVYMIEQSWRTEEGTKSLELELQMVASHLVDAGN